jgi:hypothetical protein
MSFLVPYALITPIIVFAVDLAFHFVFSITLARRLSVWLALRRGLLP